MTRSIFYFLLALTISCGNALPPQVAALETQPKTAAIAPATSDLQTAEDTATEQPQLSDKPNAAAIKSVRTSAATPPVTAQDIITTTKEATAPTTTTPTVVVSQPAPAVESTPAEKPTPTAKVSAGVRPSVRPSGQPISGKEQLRALKAADANSPLVGKNRFLPTRRRIDREVNKLKFAYKGEVIAGLTASYGTVSSDDSDILLVLGEIDGKGTIATVKPFIGYFYRDNHCLGVRFGYQHISCALNEGRYDLGESNDTSGSLPVFDFNSDNYSFGIFHRSYAGLDPKGRFGLFAEFELSMSTGSSKFMYENDGIQKPIFNDNTQLKLAFNPGAAVYIFPNVCATLSFGLGGIQYTSVTQKDEAGNKVGSRKASNMKFKLNIAAINFGMTIHMWDKKKK